MPVEMGDAVQAHFGGAAGIDLADAELAEMGDGAEPVLARLVNHGGGDGGGLGVEQLHPVISL
jgi:hypothetical protein